MMVIDKETYALRETNFISIPFQKKQIIIGHTSTSDMRHVEGWLHRHNGHFKKTAAYTVDIKGNIYQHYNPKFYSNYMGNLESDCKSILILIENEGWLEMDKEKNKLINWAGHIYNRSGKPIERIWRKHLLWAPYPKKQVTMVAELVKQLCSDFQIPRVAMSHNTKDDNLEDFTGILYCSNFDRYTSCLSPAWHYQTFKQQIEQKLLNNGEE